MGGTQPGTSQTPLYWPEKALSTHSRPEGSLPVRMPNICPRAGPKRYSRSSRGSSDRPSPTLRTRSSSLMRARAWGTAEAADRT